MWPLLYSKLPQFSLLFKDQVHLVRDFWEAVRQRLFHDLPQLNKQSNMKLRFNNNRERSVFFYPLTVTKWNNDENFTISHIPVLDFHDVLAYLSKLNLVISFLQIEFLRGFKWANYEWCHGQERLNYQQCGEKWVWKRTRAIGGFKDVGRLMHFHRQFIKSLFFSPASYTDHFLLRHIRQNNLYADSFL